MRIAVHRLPASGFTLAELLIAIALMAIVTALAAPSFKEAMLNSRRASEVNTLLRALHLARAEAIKRAVPMAVCKSNSGWQCTPDTGTWSDGYIVFSNDDRDSPPRVDRDEQVLMIQPRVDRLRIDANRNSLIYWPVSLAGTTASIVFCDERGSRAARAIVISHTGRPRVSQRDASGKALRCT